jgi:Mg2+ and Co2+ transporter CorA
MKTKDELKQMQSALASLSEDFKKFSLKFKSKADGGELEQEPDDTEDKLSEMSDMMYKMVEGIYRYVSEIESSMWNYQYNHANGHIPPIVGAEKMNKALKVLGLDGDYEASPKVIMASKGNYVVEAEMPKID